MNKMQTENKHWTRVGLFVLTVFFLSAPLLMLPAQELNSARLTGRGTLPPAPVQLVSGDAFAVAADGQGRLDYEDGSYLALKAGTSGRLTRHGLILETGEARVELRKQGKQFRIKSPKAYLVVLGTMFDLVVRPKGTEIRLYEGRLQIEPQTNGGENAPVFLEAGYQLSVTEAGLQLNQIPDDQSLLNGASPQIPSPSPANSIPETTESSSEGVEQNFHQNPFLSSPSVSPESLSEN